jgi:hypothetical protein
MGARAFLRKYWANIGSLFISAIALILAFHANLIAREGNQISVMQIAFCKKRVSCNGQLS